MTVRSQGQSWMLDTALAKGGFDALHPDGLVDISCRALTKEIQ
jgi:hypothetical protein